MRKHFAVLGLGRFGKYLALSLAKMGNSVLALDQDEKLVQDISDFVSVARVVDCTDIEALREAGVANADVAVVAIGTNIEASVLAAMALKDLGVPFIVAKAMSEIHGKILEKIGVSRVVYPEREMAERIARVLTSTNVMDIIDLSPDYTMLEEKASARMVGKTLAQIFDFGKRSGILVVAIKRNDHIIVGPSSSEKILEGDVLVIVGETKEVKSLIQE
ncbi:MAG: potassium channel family protein [bacterium]